MHVGRRRTITLRGSEYNGKKTIGRVRGWMKRETDKRQTNGRATDVIFFIYIMIQ